MPNEVRRMRWSANHRDTPSRPCGPSCRSVWHCHCFCPIAKAKHPPRPHTATAHPRPQNATSSVAWRRQLPLKGKPLAAAESRPAAETPNGSAGKSLPLEGKVPNEVRRMRWGANRRDNPTTTVQLQTVAVFDNAIACTQPQRQEGHQGPSLPQPIRGRKMPPHPSPNGDSFPSRGSPWWCAPALPNVSLFFTHGRPRRKTAHKQTVSGNRRRSGSCLF